MAMRTTGGQGRAGRGEVLGALSDAQPLGHRPSAEYLDRARLSGRALGAVVVMDALAAASRAAVRPRRG